MLKEALMLIKPNARKRQIFNKIIKFFSCRV